MIFMSNRSSWISAARSLTLLPTVQDDESARVVRKCGVGGIMDEADDLLHRALIDADASAAVALRVGGLAMSDALTVIFHGRRDLGTIQTYVANGGRGAGSSVTASE